MYFIYLFSNKSKLWNDLYEKKKQFLVVLLQSRINNLYSYINNT